MKKILSFIKSLFFIRNIKEHDLSSYLIQSHIMMTTSKRYNKLK